MSPPLVPIISAVTGARIASSAQCDGVSNCLALFGIVTILLFLFCVLLFGSLELYVRFRDRR